jgi:hypothetical protein
MFRQAQHERYLKYIFPVRPEPVEGNEHKMITG